MTGKVLRKTIPVTLPVMAGFLSLGTAFGILLQDAGYGLPWALLMSVFIYAGSAQFLCVELLAAGASLSQVAILTFLLNFRHIFYGLTMITRYRGVKRKWYLIFGLADETYAFLSADKISEGVEKDDYYLAVTALHQTYWVIGTIIGSLAGVLIPFDMAGIDFAMTALFAVLVVEQWKAHSTHFPVVLGFFITSMALLLFGADHFLILALVTICAVLLLCRKRLEGAE